MPEFIWTAKNTEHIAEHGVSTKEAEHVITHARAPWPEYLGEDKWRVWGRTEAGRHLQTIFVFAADAAEVDFSQVDLANLDDVDSVIYVIHAMPLTDSQKKAYRRRRR